MFMPHLLTVVLFLIILKYLNEMLCKLKNIAFKREFVWLSKVAKNENHFQVNCRLDKSNHCEKCAFGSLRMGTPRQPCPCLLHHIGCNLEAQGGDLWVDFCKQALLPRDPHSKERTCTVELRFGKLTSMLMF